MTTNVFPVALHCWMPLSNAASRASSAELEVLTSSMGAIGFVQCSGRGSRATGQNTGKSNQWEILKSHG